MYQIKTPYLLFAHFFSGFKPWYPSGERQMFWYASFPKSFPECIRWFWRKCTWRLRACGKNILSPPTSVAMGSERFLTGALDSSWHPAVFPINILSQISTHGLEGISSICYGWIPILLFIRIWMRNIHYTERRPWCVWVGVFWAKRPTIVGSDLT